MRTSDWQYALRGIRFLCLESLKREVKKVKSRSLAKIARSFDVSGEYVRKIAKKVISPAIFKEIWEPAVKKLSETKEIEIINQIKSTNLSLGEIARNCGVFRKTVSKISRDFVYKNDLEGHKTRFPKDIYFELGTVCHQNINAITTKAVQENSNVKYYSEPNIYPDRRKPDGIILEYDKYLYKRLTNPTNGKNLADKLKIIPTEIGGIKATQFDYTNDISDENIINKIEKYQSPDTMLLIVGTKWNLYDDVKMLPQDEKIKYINNIRVISHDLFAELIDFKGENKLIFDNIIKINYNNEIDTLRMLYNLRLSYVNLHDTNELIEDLNRKNLINKDLKELFNFKELKNQNTNGKQLSINHFILD